jgi:hypothetical protein
VIRKLWTVLVVERRLPWFVARRLDRAYWVRLVTQLGLKLVLLTRPVVADEASDTEVISLCGARDFVLYLVAIKSLLVHLPVRAAVTLISDGTLDASAERLLRKHVRGVRIVGTQAPDLSRYGAAEALLAMRRDYVLSRKILDVPLGSVKERLVIFDSDVIVRRPLPAGLFDLSRVKVRFNRDHDHTQHDRHFHWVGEYLRSRGCVTRLTDLNSGFMILDRCVLDPKAVEEFWALLARHGDLHYLMEQDAYAVLASLWTSEPLPDSFMVGARSWEPESRRNAVSLHFNTTVRYRDWTYLREGLGFLLRYAAARR